MQDTGQEGTEIHRVIQEGKDPLDLSNLGISPPPGKLYSWRTGTVGGSVCNNQILSDADKGFTPVPASRHDGVVMPKGFDGAIEYGGLMLMEVDANVDDIHRRADKIAADTQMEIAHSMGNMVGQFVGGNPDIIVVESFVRKGTT